MSTKITILGSGDSARLFQESGCPVWAVGSIFNNVRADLYFFMHDFDRVPGGCDYICRDNFPLQDIVHYYGSSFFTSTVSYMLAYALHEGVEEIDMFGVDMDSMSEYEHQKASVNFWIGYLRGKGVKVNVFSDCDKTDFLYGYEPTKKIIRVLEERLEMSQRRFEIAKSEAEKNQWIGQIFNLKYLIKRWKQ